MILNMCCCVFLFFSKGNDQGKVPEHPGEAQEVTTSLFLFCFKQQDIFDFQVNLKTCSDFDRLKDFALVLSPSSTVPLFSFR